MFCSWSDDDGEAWATGCGQLFVLIEGTPSENHMAFCCYCGKPLRQVAALVEVEQTGGENGR